MSGFRINAIMTGKSVDSYDGSFLQRSSKNRNIGHGKNLKPDTVYAFNSHYRYGEGPNGFSKIQYVPESDISPYQFRNHPDVKLNISAVVGENGTGKSTLIELIFWMNYNLAAITGLIRSRKERSELEQDLESKIKNELKIESWVDFPDARLKYQHNENEIDELYDAEIGDNYEMNTNFTAKLFYEVSESEKYIIHFQGEDIIQHELIINKKLSEENTRASRHIYDLEFLQNYFYSIVVNYSHYGLNEKEIGDWIRPLFHKNDGYQVPIVLNPKRTAGIIDINEQKRLLYRRLQSNLLEKVTGDPLLSLRNIANGKIVDRIILKYNEDFINKIQNDIIDRHNGATLYQEQQEIQEQIRIQYSIRTTPDDKRFSFFESTAYNYIHYKLYKICQEYPLYRKFIKDHQLVNIKGLIEITRNRPTHITFKLKGAIMYLKHFERLFKLTNSDDPYEFRVNELSNEIADIINEESESVWLNTSMFTAPSFFDVDLIFESDTGQFKDLSSGEKQKIFSLSSIVYHLINLNSIGSVVRQNQGLINKDKEVRVKILRYKYINIILDEIELYYHPEWQRKYIFDLIEYLNKINPKDLGQEDGLKKGITGIEGINIIFVTHSPFILSDIPSSNILKLQIDKNGKSSPSINKTRSFGANIHELLTDSFFLNKRLMGEYAYTFIAKLIDSLTDINESRIEDLIAQSDLIDEPFIKSKIKEKLDNWRTNSETESNDTNSI